MDTHEQVRLNAPARPEGTHRIAWAIGGAVITLVTVVAFGAYRQPELLLNLLGLRYCG